MNFRRSGRSTLFLAILMGIVFVYLCFFSFLDSNYSPYYGDEYFYFKNSETFYLTSRLQASFTYSGNGARLLGSDPHGPAYPLLYGSIAKLFSWGGLTIPLANLGVLLCAALALLFFSVSTAQTKLLELLLIFGSPITLFYSVTYMPELLQIAGAIGLFLLARRYLLTSNRVDFYILITYILVLGSIRSTWFFAFFGLLVLPGPIKGFGKSIYLALGLALAFLYQYFLHEQVPNTFSGLGETIEREGILAGWDAIFFNVQRNIYFAFTYTEGHFYTVQKVWIACSLIFSLTLYRGFKLIQFGVIILVTVIIFNVILYKNYSWVDLRMYTPMILFLNLGMISSTKSRLPVFVLISLNLLSFFLVIPLQKKLIGYRIQSETRTIPDQTVEDLKNLDSPLVYVDSVLLDNRCITTLPILTNKRQLIRYILPYYSMKMENPTQSLSEEDGQVKVEPVKILDQ